MEMECYQKICRACLSTEETFKYFINVNVAQDLFLFCTSVQVLPDDGLPKALCDACHEILVEFYEFKRTCLQSNETLTCCNNYLNTEPEKDKEFDTFSSKLKVKVECESSAPSHYDDTDHVANYDDNPSDTRLDHNIKPTDKIGQTCKKSAEVSQRFRFKCDQCNRKYVNKDHFEGHKLTHLGKPVIIQCQLCQKVFKEWKSLAVHKQKVHASVSNDSFQCSLCGEVSENEKTLQTHWLKHKEQEAVMCDVCGQRFRSKASLKFHRQTHDKERQRPFTCEHCGNSFFNHAYLRIHILRSHSGRRFVCDLCGYSYKLKGGLIKHILLKHEGKKLFNCDVCSKSFCGKSALIEHKRMHTGEKPYNCTYCASSFRTKPMLRDHQRIHTGEKPYKCSLCSQAFTQCGSLKRHMRVHKKTAPAKATKVKVKSHKSSHLESVQSKLENKHLGNRDI